MERKDEAEAEENITRSLEENVEVGYAAFMSILIHVYMSCQFSIVYLPVIMILYDHNMLSFYNKCKQSVTKNEQKLFKIWIYKFFLFNA